MNTTAVAVRSLIRAPHQSQQDFRVLIDVLGQPGTIQRLQLPGDAPAAAVVAAGLADVEVSFAVLDHDETWAAALHTATGASAAPLADAALALALRIPTPAEVLSLARGDALHPEFGCRLILAVAAFGDPAAEVTIRLQGPGIAVESELRISGVPAAVFEALGAANAEFPAGVDTFLVAVDGTVAGLPRSSRIQIEQGAI